MEAACPHTARSKNFEFFQSSPCPSGDRFEATAQFFAAFGVVGGGGPSKRQVRFFYIYKGMSERPSDDFISSQQHIYIYTNVAAV